MGDVAGLATSLVNQASALREMGAHQQARRLAATALGLARDHGLVTLEQDIMHLFR